MTFSFTNPPFLLYTLRSFIIPMGRSVPTYRNEVERTISHWRRCFPNLNRESQDAFDRVLLKVRRHAEAASYQVFADPVHGMLLAVILEFDKEWMEYQYRECMRIFRENMFE